jgi:anti-sigma factor RsiW
MCCAVVTEYDLHAIVDRQASPERMADVLPALMADPEAVRRMADL